MALCTRITCTRCHQPSDEWHGSGDYPPDLCRRCRAANADGTRQSHFAELDALTIEARVRKIEEWIYDYRPQYVPPQRY